MESVLIVTLALAVLLSLALIQTRRRLAAREMELALAKRERSQELAKGQAWAEALANSTSLGLVALSSQRRVTFINDAARALFDTADGIGRPIGEIAWGFDLNPSVSYILEQRNEFVHQTILASLQLLIETMTEHRLSDRAFTLDFLGKIHIQVVLADAQAIRKVLGNLLHNACKFTPPGGRIEIRAVPKNDNVEFVEQCRIDAYAWVGENHSFPQQ